MTLPERQIRAVHDDETITVYQAYPAEIALPAVAAQRFVPPFNRDRMTWIKPSYLWMMYRCGWATKPGQERVLAIRITRAGFEWALEHSCLSSHHGDPEWAARMAASPVRVQWDPERDIHLIRLQHRAIQIGLTGEAAHRYVDEWTMTITDITDEVRTTYRLLQAGDLDAAAARLPNETGYPLTVRLKEIVGSSDDDEEYREHPF
jgi:hypothetical protein